jgi:hypothetical protein
MFSVALYVLRQTVCLLAAPCPFQLPFPSFSDAAKAQSYSASTVMNLRIIQWTVLFWVVMPYRLLRTLSILQRTFMCQLDLKVSTYFVHSEVCCRCM